VLTVAVHAVRATVTKRCNGSRARVATVFQGLDQVPQNGPTYQCTPPFPTLARGVHEVVQDPPTAVPLKEAALRNGCATGPTCLTAAVVRSCDALGWRAAGKGYPLDLLPQRTGSTWAST